MRRYSGRRLWWRRARVAAALPGLLGSLLLTYLPGCGAGGRERRDACGLIRWAWRR